MPTRKSSSNGHSRVVRTTHWVTSVAVIALVVSGYVITMTHPRLYWGDAGNLEMTPWLTLPIERTLGESGWGRSLHFLGAWILVLTGTVYVILAYAMSGGELPVAHGAPVRLRVERQLGYKSLKFLSTISVTDSLDNVANGKGSGSVPYGYAWYAGI